MIRLAVRSGRYTSFICLRWRLTGLPLPFGILSAGAPSGQCSEVSPHNFLINPSIIYKKVGKYYRRAKKDLCKREKMREIFFAP